MHYSTHVIGLLLLRHHYSAAPQKQIASLESLVYRKQLVLCMEVPPDALLCSMTALEALQQTRCWAIAALTLPWVAVPWEASDRPHGLLTGMDRMEAVLATGQDARKPRAW